MSPRTYLSPISEQHIMSTDGPARTSPGSDYERLDLLDRLEELREDMIELGVSSREEIEARIATLEAEVADADLEDA